MTDGADPTRAGRPARRLPRTRLPWPLRRAVVSGRSMSPTLSDGDRLFVAPGARLARPERLVVVVLPSAEGGAGSGGDPGVVAVKRLVRREPDGGWWVERDNPREGVDSWQVGAVAPDGLLGVVVARYRPWRGFGPLR